ncbi:MAG TPA: YbjQ family protein [Eubacteriaceae bacterium]|nr:YbjQ family protein [Eubacteriaceae bacterium]
MIIVNTETIPHKEIVEVCGLVRGNTIHSKNIGKDIVAGFRNLVGGEIKEYTEMMSEARDIALDRMVEEAEKLGANAVVNVRFMTASVMQSAAELMAYGTAVKVK